MRWFRGCALAIVCLGASHAHASSSATASLGPLTVTLVDLDVADGITPSLTFAPETPGEERRASASALNPFGVVGVDEQGGPVAWADASAEVVLALSRAAASISGAAPNGNGALLIAQGSSDDFVGPTGESAQYRSIAAGPYFSGGSFTLSAATSLTISGWGSVQVQASQLQAEQHYAVASADAILGLVVYDGSDPSEAVVSGQCFSSAGEGPCTNGDARMLTVTFANATTESVTGLLFATAAASGESYANTVPEPGAWALLLSGLPLLLLRRRSPPSSATA